MRSKELRLNYVQDKIKRLERDYKTVVDSLKVEQDGPTRNNLEDQLAMIGNEIDTLENEEKAIQQELSQDIAQSSLFSLRAILQRYDGQLSDMLKAYRCVLRQRTWQLQDEPQTPDGIINQLLRIPKGKSIYKALEEFVAWLVEVTQATELIGDLQGWGEQHLNQVWVDLRQQIAQCKLKQSQPDQPALLIYISRSDEKSTQSDGDEYYQIKAWLIRDIQIYRDDKLGISQVGTAEKTGDESYALSSLPGELTRQICDFLSEIASQIESDPEIHIFLPLELMNCDVDRWPLGRAISFKRVG